MLRFSSLLDTVFPSVAVKLNSGIWVPSVGIVEGVRGILNTPMTWDRKPSITLHKASVAGPPKAYRFVRLPEWSPHEADTFRES